MDGYVLPQALVPFPDESLPGLILRNAAVYRFRDPLRLLSRISRTKLTLFSVCREDPAGDFGGRFQRLLGLDDAAFRRLSMWASDENESSVLGQCARSELLMADRLAVCPLCLRESAHHRAVWMINTMPVCPVHGVWLRDRCHRCTRPLKWVGSNIHRCSVRRCAADLREAPVEPVDASRMDGIRGLHDVLHAADPKAASPLGLPFGELLRLGFVIGKLARGHHRNARAPGFTKRERDLMPEIMTAGWNAFQDWPHGLHRLLDHLQQSAGERRGKEGVRKAFGILPNLIHEWAREPWGQPIGAAFAAYVASTGKVGTSVKTLQRYAPGTKVEVQFHTGMDLQRRLGISAGTVHRVATRHGIYTLPPEGMGRTSLVAPEDAQRLETVAKDSLTPEQARRLLGVGRRVFEQLVEAGVVRVMSVDERVLDNKPFLRSELNALVAATIAGSPVISPGQARQQKLTTLISATGPGRPVADIVQAVVDGRVPSVGRVSGTTGLMQSRVRMDDVGRVLPSSKATLSTLDASKECGIRYNMLNDWAKAGHLRMVNAQGPAERGMRITHEDWTAFRRDYASGSDLAKELGHPGNIHVSSHLRFVGIEPVSGPGIDHSRLYLFRRADIDEEALGKVRDMLDGVKPSASEKRASSTSRIPDVLATVAHLWGAAFRRDNNTYTDRTTGRVLQLVSGSRPDRKGMFVFSLQNTTRERLLALSDSWVALIAEASQEFILAPMRELQWRGEHLEAAYLRLRFDGHGRAMECRHWVHTSTVNADPKPQDAKSDVPQVGRREYPMVAAGLVAAMWGTTLERSRNTFRELGGNRLLQVVRGKRVGQRSNFVFTVTRETMTLLQASDGERWLALVPSSGVEMMLVPFDEAPWSGGRIQSAQLSVRFDDDGRLQVRRWAVQLTYLRKSLQLADASSVSLNVL